MKTQMQKFQTNSYLNTTKKPLVMLGLVLLASTQLTLASASSLAKEKTVATTVRYSATPLCVAISKGDFETVKKLIEYGCDVNETRNGMTPLMFAARYNNLEIAKLLIQKGAVVEAKDQNGYTAYDHAQAGKALEVADYLKSISKKRK